MGLDWRNQHQTAPKTIKRELNMDMKEKQYKFFFTTQINIKRNTTTGVEWYESMASNPVTSLA